MFYDIITGYNIVTIQGTFKKKKKRISTLFRPHHAARRTLFSLTGIAPVPPAMEAVGPNHWTAREVSRMPLLN